MSKEAEPAIGFVELASLSEPSLVVTAIASALSLQEVPDSRYSRRYRRTSGTSRCF